MNMKLSHFYHALLCSCLSVSLYLNFSLIKDIDNLRSGVHSSNAMSIESTMKVEMALQMLSDEGPREVERIAREVFKDLIKKQNLNKEENNAPTI